MTHSHDTSTPAVSDETVPSEEFVLVPKEFLDFLRHAPVGSGTCCCGDDMQKHSNSEHSPVDMWDHELDQWLKQIATLPASHLAKEGGEAGAAAPPAKLAHRIVLHCQNTPPEEAIEIAERLIVTALNHPMNVPQPSPALAKGGDAVRAAAQAVIDSATNTYRKRNGQMGTIEGEDGEMSWIVPFDPFEQLRAALMAGSCQPLDNVGLRERFADLSRRISEITTLPKPTDLYYAIKNEGVGTGWTFSCSGVTADDIHKAVAALASDPAPAGEAVEPVARLDGVDEYGPRLGWFKQWTKVPVGTLFYVHPAPEDTARLREELERDGAQAVLDGHHAEHGETPSMTASRARIAERERDDARKALGALEAACDRLAALRSHGVYLHMLDDEGAGEALQALDAARTAARAALATEASR